VKIEHSRKERKAYTRPAFRPVPLHEAAVFRTPGSMPSTVAAPAVPQQILLAEGFAGDTASLVHLLQKHGFSVRSTSTPGGREFFRIHSLDTSHTQLPFALIDFRDFAYRRGVLQDILAATTLPLLSVALLVDSIRSFEGLEPALSCWQVRHSLAAPLLAQAVASYFKACSAIFRASHERIDA
jgi:hypothetical protein